MVNKKRVSKVLVFVLLIGTLLSSVAFAADVDTTDWVVAEDIKIKTTAHIQKDGDKDFSGNGQIWFGTTGEKKRVEKISIGLEGEVPEDMRIMYMAHVQKDGDTKWTEGPNPAGTHGEAKRIEGIAIKLVDEAGKEYPGYVAEYQVHMAQYGWGINETKNDKKDDNKINDSYKEWASNGTYAGTRGEARRIEAVRLRIRREDELKVKSVSAINAKQIKVVFNTAVEKSSVIDSSDDLETGVVTLTRTSTDSPANVVGDGALDGYSAELSEDGKTLIITEDTVNGYFKGNYDVKVSNAVKKGTVDKMENYYGKFVANDTVAPKVTEVTYNVVTDKFEIKLSKPVDSLAGEVVRINGQPQSLDSISAPTDKLTVDRPADVEPGTTASIYIAGIEDAAGNLMDSYTGNVVVQKDTAALAVNSVEQIQNQKVRVTFNKKLDSTSNTNMLAGTGLVVIKSDGSTTTNFTVAAAPAAENPNDNKYDITLSDATYANGNTENFSITFVEDAFKGVSGTKNKVFTKNLTLTKDTVKPTISSAKLAVNGEAVEVTLSKDINSVDASKVKLRKDGVELTGVTATKKLGVDNVIVVTNTAAGTKLGKGSYQVRFEADAVTDINGNKNATANAPIVTVTSDTTVDPAKAVITTTGTNEFTIKAPGTEKFKPSSLNYTNFVLDGKVIPANSDITFAPDNTTIVVKLPAKNAINITGPALLKASNLEFVSGNPYAATTETVTVTDNTPATMNAARLVGNTLELTFDEKVDATKLTNLADVLGDFEIKSDAATFIAGDATATIVKGSNDNKIVITIAPGTSNWTSVVGGTNLTISTIEDASTGQVAKLTDANNVKVKAPVKVSVSK